MTAPIDCPAILTGNARATRQIPESSGGPRVHPKEANHRRRRGHRGNPVPDVTWFQLKSADLKDACLVEKGTTDAAYGAPCSSNHSDYWKWTSTGELLNEHSGKCLSVTGDDPVV